MERKFLLILFFYSLECYAGAQVLATLEVDLKNDNALFIPVKIDLDAITLLPDSVLQLVEINGKSKTAIQYQIEYSDKRILNWIILQATNGKRVFQLLKGAPYKSADHIRAIADNGFLTISNNTSNLLRYNYKTIYPPKAVDTVYNRSRFINPLSSPRGQE